MINGSLLPRNTENLTAVGFEPTPPKWLVAKNSALDHSATLSCDIDLLIKTFNY